VLGSVTGKGSVVFVKKIPPLALPVHSAVISKPVFYSIGDKAMMEITGYHRRIPRLRNRMSLMLPTTADAEKGG